MPNSSGPDSSRSPSRSLTPSPSLHSSPSDSPLSSDPNCNDVMLLANEAEADLRDRVRGADCTPGTGPGATTSSQSTATTPAQTVTPVPVLASTPVSTDAHTAIARVASSVASIGVVSCTGREGNSGNSNGGLAVHRNAGDQSVDMRARLRHPANGRLVMDVAIRCTVPSCSCDCFTPCKGQIRACDACKHGWVAHAVDKLGFRHLYNCNQVEVVQPNVVFDIASLMLYGCQAMPIRLKILLDRLFSVLQHEEVLQVLHGFGWGYEDYARGYILQDAQGNVLDRWILAARDEEPLILQQFLRFGETKAITQHILLQENSERPDLMVQAPRSDSDIKKFIERTNRVTNPYYRASEVFFGLKSAHHHHHHHHRHHAASILSHPHNPLPPPPHPSHHVHPAMAVTTSQSQTPSSQPLPPPPPPTHSHPSPILSTSTHPLTPTSLTISQTSKPGFRMLSSSSSIGGVTSGAGSGIAPGGCGEGKISSGGGSTAHNLSPTCSSRSFGSPVNCTSPLSVSPLNRLQSMQPYDFRRERSPEPRPIPLPTPPHLPHHSSQHQQHQHQQSTRPSSSCGIPHHPTPQLQQSQPHPHQSPIPPPAENMASMTPLQLTTSSHSHPLPHHLVLPPPGQHQMSHATSSSSLLATSDMSASDGGSDDDASVSGVLNLSRSAVESVSVYATKKVKHLRKSANPMKRRWNPNMLSTMITNPASGKKRVQCTVCLKTFCDKGALKIHFSAVHLKEMHKCTVDGCNMMFSSRRSRNRHSANPNPKLHTPHLRRKISPHDGRTANPHPMVLHPGLLPNMPSVSPITGLPMRPRSPMSMSMTPYEHSSRELEPGEIDPSTLEDVKPDISFVARGHHHHHHRHHSHMNSSKDINEMHLVTAKHEPGVPLALTPNRSGHSTPDDNGHLTDQSSGADKDQDGQDTKRRRLISAADDLSNGIPDVAMPVRGSDMMHGEEKKNTNEDGNNNNKDGCNISNNKTVGGCDKDSAKDALAKGVRKRKSLNPTRCAAVADDDDRIQYVSCDEVSSSDTFLQNDSMGNGTERSVDFRDDEKEDLDDLKTDDDDDLDDEDDDDEDDMDDDDDMDDEDSLKRTTMPLMPLNAIKSERLEHYHRQQQQLLRNHHHLAHIHHRHHHPHSVLNLGLLLEKRVSSSTATTTNNTSNGNNNNSVAIGATDLSMASCGPDDRKESTDTSSNYDESSENALRHLESLSHGNFGESSPFSLRAVGIHAAAAAAAAGFTGPLQLPLGSSVVFPTNGFRDTTNSPKPTDGSGVGGGGGGGGTSSGGGGGGGSSPESPLSESASANFLSGFPHFRDATIAGNVEIPVDKDNPRRCTACGKIFQNHFGVKTHYQNVHLKLMHKCTVDGCNAAFPSKRSRDRHSANLNLHRKLLSTSDRGFLEKGLPFASLAAAAAAAASGASLRDDFLSRIYGEPPVLPLNMADTYHALKFSSSLAEQMHNANHNFRMVSPPPPLSLPLPPPRPSTRTPPPSDMPTDFSMGGQKSRVESPPSTSTSPVHLPVSSSSVSVPVPVPVQGPVIVPRPLAAPAVNFNLVYSLEDDLPSPDASGNFPCKFCHKRFPDGILLKEHYEKLHTPEMFRCVVSGCNKIFSSQKKRNSHSQNESAHKNLLHLVSSSSSSSSAS